MATLLLSVIGTVVGGPLGGAIGAMVGQQVDARLFAPPGQRGPRLKELTVTTSSYGTPVPMQFGKMRAPGTIIWSTDLVEQRQRRGGGKGRPKVTTYSYSTSFAVALSSRPIQGVGRIWADGNLLRGAAGDLKTGGALRIHTGEGDQRPDPLIAAAEGEGQCPAFRGLAYAVFEDLELGDFGNRIPALSFEVFADDGPVTLDALIAPAIADVDAGVTLPGLAGFACEGPLIESLGALDPVYPLDCDACGNLLTFAPERLQTSPIGLAEAAISVEDGDFGGREGRRRVRAPAGEDPVGILRYYDIARDFQPGLQRVAGHRQANQPRAIELPAALQAEDARNLAEAAARRSGWARETLSWRTSELDPAIAPGVIVTVPGETGRWRVEAWEWRASGVELSLTRLPPASLLATGGGDPGRAANAPDLVSGTTLLNAFELPWDGSGSGDTPSLFAAVSSASPGWSGAALFADSGDGQLVPLGASGRARAVMGQLAAPLPPADPLLADRQTQIDLLLAAADMTLASATLAQLAAGANRALLGEEVIQFAAATPMDGGVWRLSGLLRGRGGTEVAALAGHVAGTPFILLDDALVPLDPALVGSSPATVVTASGLGDETAVTAGIAGRGATLRPLVPVHPRRRLAPDGTLNLAWTRRARGGWTWADGVDVPLNEQSEAYQVGFGPVMAPLALWEVTSPEVAIPPSQLATLAAALPGGRFHVCQRGSHALSAPLLLGPLP